MLVQNSVVLRLALAALTRSAPSVAHLSMGVHIQRHLADCQKWCLQDTDEAAASVTLKFDPHKDYYKVGPSVSHGLGGNVFDVNTCLVQAHGTLPCDTCLAFAVVGLRL